MNKVVLIIIVCFTAYVLFHMTSYRGGRGRGRRPGTRENSNFFSQFPSLPSTSTAIKPAKTAKDILEEGPKYVQKPIKEDILYLSSYDLKLSSDPWGLKDRYLQNHHYQMSEGKPRFFYESLLTETQSLQIKHTYVEDGNFKSPISYSKCYIVKVLQPQEWGLSPFAIRTLKNEYKCIDL